VEEAGITGAMATKMTKAEWKKLLGLTGLSLSLSLSLSGSLSLLRCLVSCFLKILWRLTGMQASRLVGAAKKKLEQRATEAAHDEL
jgi:hypothetical protein